MVRWIRLSSVVLLAVLCISAFFGWKAASVDFDYDFEKFFPEKDKETSFFYEHQQRFEPDNDFIFLALQRKEGIFNRDFLTRVSQLVDTISKDTSVVQVQCLTHLKDYVKTPFSAVVAERKCLRIDSPETYQKDSAFIFKRPELVEFFINKKADALLVWIKHLPKMSKEDCDLLVERIDGHLDDMEFKDFKYAGRAIGMGYYVDRMQYETVFFIGLSFVLVIIFLIFTFKSIWGVLVPLSVVMLSMVWIVGFMASMGQPINLVLTVLPSIIFVVAMSDVIHLVSKYFEELRSGKDKLSAVKKAYREVGFATLLTSVTTSIGFLTLLTIDMEPIRHFGIYIAVGVMFAFFLAYTFLPAMLVLTKPPKVAFKKLTTNLWYKFLHGSFIQLIRHRKSVGITFVFILGIGVFGMTLVESNYFLLEDIKKDAPLRKDYHYFDKEFMGLRPFEISVRTKNKGDKITDYKVLRQIDKVEKYLTDEYGLKRTFSIVTAIKMANRVEHGGQNKYYKLPAEEETKKILQRLDKFDRSRQLDLLVDSTETYGRISSTLGDVGRYEIDRRNKRFYDFLEKNVDDELIELKLTGTAHLLDRNMTKLSQSLTVGLLLAVGIVALLMGFLYRSARIVLIAIIPNILPLIMLAAVLGFSGINLTVSTSIVFTISFGIAVDDTIHFMSKFKLEMNKGRSFMYALKRTYLSTGRAIILTTLILCSGFLMLILSDFLGTFYIGLLICCTLMFALLADLLFLPVLMVYFYNYNRKK